MMSYYDKKNLPLERKRESLYGAPVSLYPTGTKPTAFCVCSGKNVCLCVTLRRNSVIVSEFRRLSQGESWYHTRTAMSDSYDCLSRYMPYFVVVPHTMYLALIREG